MDASKPLQAAGEPVTLISFFIAVMFKSCETNMGFSVAVKVTLARNIVNVTPKPECDTFHT